MIGEDKSDRLAELATLWPYDGPHSAESVTQAAEAVNQLVRYIANATRREDRYPYMSPVGRVAGSLGMASHRLDQVLDQMKTAVERHARNGDLYDDRRSEARGAGSAAACVAVDHVEGARIRFAALDLRHDPCGRSVC